MIVIAVAASLVAYAWVMGYLGFTTAKVGKAIQIQSISYDDPDPTYMTVYVQNVGDSDLTVSDIYVDGVQDNTAPLAADLGTTETQGFILEQTWATQPAQVTVKVVTTDGISTELKKTFTSGAGGGGNGGTTQYALTIGSLTGGTGTGSVGLNPAGGTYDEDTVVTVTATADSGSEFIEWGGDLSGSTNPTTITMDGDKTITATFNLESQTVTLYPENDGSTDDLQNNWGWSDNENWQFVDDDEASPDGDTTYVYKYGSGDSWTQDTYITENSPVSSGTISSVTVFFRCRESSGNGQARAVIRTYSNDYQGTSESLTSSWQLLSYTWDTNPATSGQWTWSQINNMEIGVELQESGSGNEIRCTQVYVEVVYT